MVLKTIKIEVFCDLCHAPMETRNTSEEAVVGRFIPSTPPVPFTGEPQLRKSGKMYVQTVGADLGGDLLQGEMTCFCRGCKSKINEVLNQQKALRGSTHPVTGEDL